MFEWKPQLSLGIPHIDAQHQNLFAVARELHQAMMQGQGKAVLAPILDHLVHYTASHFAEEEAMMKQHNFPGLANHAEEHAALTAQVKRFQAEFQSGKAAITVQILQFLKSWLENHIQHSDMAYAPHTRSRAVA